MLISSGHLTEVEWPDDVTLPHDFTEDEPATYPDGTPIVLAEEPSRFDGLALGVVVAMVLVGAVW